MSPAASWLLLAAAIAVFVGPTWLVCRRAERRCVRGCARPCCMPDLPHHLDPANANDPVRLDSNRVVASRPHERHRL